MPLTRQQAETEIIGRVGRLMTAAGLDGETSTGSNADLNSPLAAGLLTLGYTVADISNVSSAEVGAVEATLVRAFLDVAELRALENTLGNLDVVDLTVGPRKESLSQLSRQVQARIKDLRNYIQVEHNIGSGLLAMGNLDLNFAAKGDDEIVGP
jgi:hypothetical protein